MQVVLIRKAGVVIAARDFETRPSVTPTLNPCKQALQKTLQVVLTRKARVVIAARDFETRPQVTPAGCQALLMITAKQLWRHGQLCLPNASQIRYICLKAVSQVLHTFWPTQVWGSRVFVLPCFPVCPGGKSWNDLFVLHNTGLHQLYNIGLHQDIVPNSPHFMLYSYSYDTMIYLTHGWIFKPNKLQTRAICSR